jgi:hypothetical protein
MSMYSFISDEGLVVGIHDFLGLEDAAEIG